MKLLITVKLLFLQTSLISGLEQDRSEQRKLFKYIVNFNNRRDLEYHPKISVINGVDKVGHVSSDYFSSKGMRPSTFAAAIKGSRELFIFLFKHGADPDFVEELEPECPCFCFGLFGKPQERYDSARWQIRSFLHDENLKLLHPYLIEILAHCSVDNITKERTWMAMAYGVKSNQPKKQKVRVVSDPELTVGQQAVQTVRRFFNPQESEISIAFSELNKTDNDIIPLV